jgi:hypothetical protein
MAASGGVGIRRVCAAACALALSGLMAASANRAAPPASRPLVMAHYMPWYASREISGAWGWHWTMGRYNPERTLPDGRREAASHDYPLIGLYDSGDDDALECHVLLMKVAGLDGAIADWYGTRRRHDYPVIHRNTDKLFGRLKKAGLKFAVCYEDQALKEPDAPGGDETQAWADLGWAETRWFADPSYARIGGRPALPVFGPQHLQRDQWDRLRAGLSSRPLLLGLPHLAKDAGADGVLGWPPVHGGRPIPPEEWRRYLSDLYARLRSGETVMGVAFPGFRDIYAQAGVRESYGSIDARQGTTFSETLDLALASRAPIVQVATWNDFGEGTAIEPTCGNGYSCLERLQRKLGAGRGYRSQDLRLPVELYELRKRGRSRPDARAGLDRAASLLVAGKCAEARLALTGARRLLERTPAPNAASATSNPSMATSPRSTVSAGMPKDGPAPARNP